MMDYELNENFSINDDNMADWALRKIKDEEDERYRLISIAQNQIDELKEKIDHINEVYDNKSKFLKSHLGLYFERVKKKETKTQKSYKLLSGSLVYKKPSQKINHNDDELLTYLEGSAQEEFIKVKKSVDWAEFKKQLVIQDGKVVDKELGVIIEGCTVEDVPASFDIKFSKEE